MQARDELVAMDLVPRLIELLPLVWQTPAEAAAAAATGSSADRLPAEGAAGAESDQVGWQSMDPTRTIGPLLCLSHLAQLQTPGLLPAVKPLVDMLGWVHACDERVRAAGAAGADMAGARQPMSLTSNYTQGVVLSLVHA